MDVSQLLETALADLHGRRDQLERRRAAGEVPTAAEIAEVLRSQWRVAVLADVAGRVPVEIVRPGDRIAVMVGGPELEIAEVERVREWPGVRVVTVEGDRLFFDLSEMVVLVEGAVL